MWGIHSSWYSFQNLYTVSSAVCKYRQQRLYIMPTCAYIPTTDEPNCLFLVSLLSLSLHVSLVFEIERTLWYQWMKRRRTKTTEKNCVVTFTQQQQQRHRLCMLREARFFILLLRPSTWLCICIFTGVYIL